MLSKMWPDAYWYSGEPFSKSPWKEQVRSSLDIGIAPIAPKDRSIFLFDMGGGYVFSLEAREHFTPMNIEKLRPRKPLDLEF